MGEVWKPFPGFEDSHAISDRGRVKRTIPGTKCPRGYIRQAKPNNSGYIRISMRKNGKRKTVAIHRAVLQAFVGPCPDGYVCNHKNGDKTDNRLENLEWVTQKQNVHHALHVTGAHFIPHGEEHGESKLTADEVREIRRLYDTGEYRYVDLAEMYDVSFPLIGYIIRGETWTHI